MVESMLINVNLRRNVTREFGSQDVKTSTFMAVNTATDLCVGFDPELRFIKKIDRDVKNCNFPISNTVYVPPRNI